MAMFDPEISRGTRIVQIIGGFVVLGIFAAIITFLGIGWNNAAADTRTAQKNYNTQVDKTEKLQDEYNKLYKEFQAATGQKPQAASPEDVKQSVGQPGATGDRGAKGDMGLPGQTGPAGATGAAGANGKDGLNGANGKDGLNGTDGKNGADGQPGPKGDTGATGATGQPGPAGTNGVGIQSVSCDGDGATSVWNFTFTDGTTSTVAGPCRLSLLP